MIAFPLFTLLISRYVMDCQPYNISSTIVTWESCTLRAWLNNDFLATAFSAEEQNVILKTNVDNGISQGVFSTNGGGNTQDKIFLLSYNEAFNMYFSSNKARRCAPTDYALAKGVYTYGTDSQVDGRNAGLWWLRSPGPDQDLALNVGLFGVWGNYTVNYAYIGIRPAFWINSDSGIF